MKKTIQNFLMQIEFWLHKYFCFFFFFFFCDGESQLSIYSYKMYLQCECFKKTCGRDYTWCFRKINKYKMLFLHMLLKFDVIWTRIAQVVRLPLIVLVGRVLTNGPGDLGSIPGRVLPKTLKMVLDTSLQYKVRIKGKVEPSREWSSTLLFTRCSSYWKGSLLARPRLRSPTLRFDCEMMPIFLKHTVNLKYYQLF